MRFWTKLLVAFLMGMCATSSTVARDLETQIEVPVDRAHPSLSPLVHTKGIPRIAFPENTFDPTQYSVLGEPCAIDLSARAVAKAMIRVEISAPCAAKQEALISEGTFEYGARLAIDGTAQFEFPALSETVQVSVRMRTVQQKLTVKIPEFAELFRIALKSTQRKGLALTPHGDFWTWVSPDSSVQVVTKAPSVRKGTVQRVVLTQTSTKDSCDVATDVALFIAEPGYLTQERLLRLRPMGCNDLRGNKILKTVIPDMRIAQN